MRLLIVGAGGIGSWLAHFLNHSHAANQLSGIEVCMADDDTVDTKNIRYQNFELKDITDPKVDSLRRRYPVIYTPIRKRIISSETLLDYDCIVSAVDNSIFRKLLFTTAAENPKLFWIDLRSEGRAIAFYTKNDKNTLDKMLKTLPTEETHEGSCQLPWELQNNVIQNGNKIIASIGSQLILNWYRGEPCAAEFSFRF